MGPCINFFVSVILTLPGDRLDPLVKRYVRVTYLEDTSSLPRYFKGNSLIWGIICMYDMKCNLLAADALQGPF